MIEAILMKLRESPEFASIMKSMEEQRPIVPRYVPQQTKEAQEVLMEKIKFEMARQDGFDRLFALLVGRKAGPMEVKQGDPHG